MKESKIVNHKRCFYFKSKLLILKGFLFSVIQINAQNYLWTKTFGGNLFDIGNSINVDASGNVYNSGFFYNTVDFNPGSGIYNMTSNGQRDIYIQKLDASGNFVWAKSFGNTESEFAKSCGDSSGNYYTTGYFKGTIDFDPGSGVANLTSSPLGSLFIQKLNASGNFVWAKSINTDGGVSDTIITDSAGNVYITGNFSLTVDFDPGIEVANLTSTGDFADVFVLKLDASGNYVWAKSFGGASGDLGNIINVDENGNVYSAGVFRGTADFDPGSSVYNLTSLGIDDVYIQKLDASGNFVWATSYGSLSDNLCYALKIDNSGNIYTTGQYKGTIQFNNGNGVTSYTSNGDSDFYILKLNNSGNFIWAKSIGGSGSDSSTLSLDNEGNIYSAGSFNNTVDFNPNAGVANLTSNGLSDAYILKLDSSGNFIWVKSFGGVDLDVVNSLFVNSSLQIHSVGYFFETVDFDPGIGAANFTSLGFHDVYVQKLNQNSMGLPEELNGIRVKVYPNPSEGFIQITTDSPIDNVEINLTNVNGQLIYSKSINLLNSEPLEITSPSGIYFLSIKTPKNQSIIKIIKN